MFIYFYHFFLIFILFIYVQFYVDIFAYLLNWDKYEQEKPWTFSGMYFFHCRKIDKSQQIEANGQTQPIEDLMDEKNEDNSTAFNEDLDSAEDEYDDNEYDDNDVDDGFFEKNESKLNDKDLVDDGPSWNKSTETTRLSSFDNSEENDIQEADYEEVKNKM